MIVILSPLSLLALNGNVTSKVFIHPIETQDVFHGHALMGVYSSEIGKTRSKPALAPAGCLRPGCRTSRSTQRPRRERVEAFSMAAELIAKALAVCPSNIPVEPPPGHP
jgi:hypothetical protein